MSIKKEIQDLVKEAYLEDALALFIAEADNPQLKKELSLLSASLFALKQKERRNIIYPVDANIERAKITDSLLSLLDEWEFNNSQEELETAILRLDIDNDINLGTLQMLNCNRKIVKDSFEDYFYTRLGLAEKAQFYFICACPNEMPNSFAERIIHEIRGNEEEKIIYFQQRQHDNDFLRVRAEKIPFENYFPNAQKNWRKAMQMAFNFDKSLSLEQFIQTETAKLKYDYVFFIFTISETQWQGSEEKMIAYFQWIIDIFKNLHEDAPHFLFFFTIDLHDYPFCHTSHQVEMFQKIDSFCKKNNQSLLTELKPVSQAYIKDWFKDDIRIYNPNDCQVIINSYFKEKENTLKDKDFAMKDIEPLQEKVVKMLRKKRLK